MHRLWKYVQQRWVYWLHGGVRGAVAEHRFTQIWNYANKILTGKSGRGPDCSVLNRMAHAVDEQCTERFKLVGFTPFSEDELTEDDLLVRPRSVRPTACFLPNAEAVEK